MPERPINPPLNKMVREITTPDHSAGFFTELVSRESARFQALHPIKRGTRYEATLGADQRTIDAFPALYFLKEVNPLGFGDVRSAPSDQYVLWYWGSIPDSEDSFNAEISYLGDAVANPVYARTYIVRRATHEITPTIALGSPLTALIGIRVSAAGSGYEAATVSITGGSGTGAAAEVVIDAAGGISEIIVTNEGSGYTTAPTITVVSASGSGATAVGIIQSQSAILTSQKKIELDQNDPFSHEFVRVLRVYELLPGPYLPFTRYDENLGPIQGRRRAVVNSSQITVLGATSKKTYEAREGSSYVLWEIEESWSDGTGSAGNPAYPILKTNFFDPERGAILQVSQITTDTSTAGSSVASGGTVTTIKYEPYQDNPNLRKKITETWAVPRTLTGQTYEGELDIVYSYTKTREAAGTSIGTAREEVDPQGDGTDLTTSIDATTLQAALDAYVISFPSTANLDLPDVLVSVAAVMEKTQGDGDSDETGDAGSVDSSSSLSLRATGQASAAIMPAVQINIKETWTRNVPTMHYFFYLASPVTSAAVLTKMTTLAGASVTAWPQFAPVVHMMTLTGERLSLQVSASGSWSEGAAGGTWEHHSYSGGTGASREVGLSVQSVRIPPTIHGLITVSGTTTDTEVLDVEADVDTSYVGVTTQNRTESGSVAASVTPTSFAATAGTAAIPTSGLRLYKCDASPSSKYGRIRIHTEVVNFADVI